MQPQRFTSPAPTTPSSGAAHTPTPYIPPQSQSPAPQDTSGLREAAGVGGAQTRTNQQGNPSSARQAASPNPPPHPGGPVSTNPTGDVQAQSTPRQNQAIATRRHPSETDEYLTDRISDKKGGSKLSRRLVYSCLSFMILFAILLISKTIFDHNRLMDAQLSTFEADLTADAQGVSQAIDSQTAIMSMALSLSRDPQTIAEMAANGRNVRGTTVLDDRRTVLAQTNSAGQALSQIDISNMNDGATRIASLIQAGTGTTTPVIIQRSRDLYLLIALRPGSLLSNPRDIAETSLAMNNGRLIDAPDEIGLNGAYSFYELSPARLAQMANVVTPQFIRAEANGEPVWLGAAPVPNSNGSLLLIDRKNRTAAIPINENLFLFGLIFAGMAWLIWMLMSELLVQIRTLRDIKTRDEISKQRYEAAIEGSQGGVWEIDLSRNSAFLSGSLARLFNLGQSETTLTLPQFLGLFEAGDRDKLYNAIRRAHQSGQFDLELGASSVPLFVACRGRPSVRGSDKAKVILGVAIDITEMRGAQARLISAEARLHDALGGMNDSFVIWDQMDRLVLWNTKFEDFFGFKIGNLHAGLEYHIVEHYADQVIESISPVSDGLGNEILLKDGRWIRYLETHTADGGRVSIGTDITAIRQREAELEANRDHLESTIGVLKKSQMRIVELAESYEQEKIRAEEASQSKSEFLANMSHELRTPLNAINGFSDIMQKEMFGPLGDPRYKEYVSDILFSGQHLLSLINDILDMSKIEAGKMTLNSEMLSINEMIAQVIRIVRGRADENRLKLIFDEVDVQDIEADPRAVKQVLLNLATNAIKFTPEGGSVTIRVEPKTTGIMIHVTDTGIGISEEDIERLAQPFEQVDSQHTRKHEGTGLGLALSKSLVELHGGKFTISSTLGEGTTVTFSLPNKPLARPEPQKDTEVSDEITRLAQDIAIVLKDGEAAVRAHKQQVISNAPSGSRQALAPQRPVQTPPPMPQPYAGPEAA